jgi:hypothetical protein
VTANVSNGQRFSHVYLERGKPVDDSPRMRVRLRSLAMDIEAIRTSTIVEDELGLEFSTWRKFFDTAATRDLLDFCDYRLSPGGETTIHRRDISREMGSRRSANLCRGKFTLPARLEGRRAFFPGQELVRVTAAAIVILPSPRCTNSLDALNKGLAALANAPPDGKEAIRGIFSAIEGLFRLTFPDVERLGTKASDRLRPLILTSYPGDRPAIEAIRENAVKEAARRYSPAAVVKVSHDVVSGVPAEISTSYAERGNLSIRMACRRCTRLTMVALYSIGNPSRFRQCSD